MNDTYITYTGNEVNPSNDKSPHLADIAVQLGRIVRFAGGLDPWWSVLHHLTVCKEILRYEKKYHELTDEGQKLAQLHILLHDAHEMVTSDIPKPWKCQGNRDAQENIDVRIFAHFNIPEPKGVIKELIKTVDLKALRAEGYTLGNGNLSLFFAKEADGAACKIVLDILHFYERDDTTSGFNSQMVKDYMREVTKLLTEYNAERSSR